jgi:hypothetical protein
MSTRRRDQRGQSVSVYVVLVAAALIMTTGLVVDGGQKVAASSRAESAAAGAARAAGNAAATQALAGSDSAGSAVTAAKAYLTGEPGVSGSVSIRDGVVTVRTESTAPTLFLSVIGIASVTANGMAEANIVATGQTR